MRNLVKIESMNGLARDLSSHAVISTSTEAYESYKMRKSIAAARNENYEKQQVEIDTMKQDISEIKSMLQALLQR